MAVNCEGGQGPAWVQMMMMMVVVMLMMLITVNPQSTAY
jgi:hypothetical protein